MKKFFFSLLGLCIVTTMSATIYRVGYTGFNVPGTDFAYNDLQSACNAAANNDTIQIYQQTANTSNGATLYKPLRLMGFGHSLNINSGLQSVNKVDSNINATSLGFAPGSEGSIAEGLNLSTVDLSVGQITITRCRFRQGITNTGYAPCYGGSNLLSPRSGYYSVKINIGYYGNCSNITVSDCFFDGYNDYANCIVISNYNNAYKAENLAIINNYFGYKVSLMTNVPGQVSGIFSNNILSQKFQKLYNIYAWNGNVCSEGSFYYSDYSMHSDFDQFIIKNNIFNTADTVTWPINAENCIVQNNIFSCASTYAGTTLSSSNNIFKATMSTVFGPLWNDGLVYNDNQLALGSSSPAINAGIKFDNTPTNCGVFGGEAGQDYILSGIPDVPAVYQLSTPGVNATANPYNVTISIRSNK